MGTHPHKRHSPQFCDQTAGWIKVPLVRVIELGAGDIVSNEDPALPRVTQPLIFGPYLLWPNGWMDQDITWYGGRPRPRRHCVRCRPSSPRVPTFRHMYCGETAGWIKKPLIGIGVGLGPDHIVSDGEPAPPIGPQHPHLFGL